MVDTNYTDDSSTPAGGTAVPLGDNSAAETIVEQARGRSDGFQYDDERAIGSPPNWAAYDSNELYLSATVDNEPASAEATGQTWLGHASELDQVANELYTAISELGAAWVGQGAGAAQGALVAIANSGSQAAEAARTMGHRLGQQAAAAAELKKMPAGKEFDPGQELAEMLAGGPAALTPDMKAKFDECNAVKAQQVQYFNAFTKAMSEVDNTTPSFGPESLGLKPVATNPDAVGGSVGSVGAFGLAGGHGMVDGVAGRVGGQLGAVASEHVAASGDQGAPGAAPTPAAPGAGSSVGVGAVAPGQGPAPSGGGSNLGLIGGAALGAGLGAAGAKALAKGNRSGSTKQSAAETGASANSGQGASAASVTPQGQGVVSPGGTIGGGQVPPSGAAPMAPGMGARQAEEDKEHTHASFLIEPDPDDAFGANEATPPPVIGAWTEAEDR
ncbi:hypothetical protein SAMN05421810_102903 [Amycolatopsis arida]|uniref:PPE family protein n=1 Tax=Amycolatopsis arida TaxID=587909 RepID=A0A1I5R6T9_9PSEU|nr:hypothetical protein [Amycolatopsis arida]TDX99102.1 hypothetical protein CLV69_101904 [Amycolatopsis arida]SFP54229.1 hypothetical protein SAMN05421810_102903 [Amycolatopsis arida]